MSILYQNMSTLDMFWYKLPQKWSIVGSTSDKNFNFSKVLLSQKFNNNSFIIEVKKKILYYIVYPTWWWNIDPIKSRVKFVVEIFFLHCHTYWILIEFWGYWNFWKFEIFVQSYCQPYLIFGVVCTKTCPMWTHFGTIWTRFKFALTGGTATTWSFMRYVCLNICYFQFILEYWLL